MSEPIDLDALARTFGELRAVKYNCDCQVGGVDATSVDADWLHLIGKRGLALLAEVERLRAENENLREHPRDEFHTMDELYEYRMLYNAAAVNAWEWPTVKSWVHSDGGPCFGGGWFIVVATLPTGQVSNHYEAEHWDLFHVSEAVPPMYDGHTPQIAAERLTALLQGPYGDPTAHDPAGCPVCRHALGLPEPATLVLSPEIWCDVCGAWHIPTSCSTANGAGEARTDPRAANRPGMALGDTPQAEDAGEVQS